MLKVKKLLRKKKKEKIIQIEQKLEAPAKPWNKVCPIRGGKVKDDSVTIEYNGKDYGFCCPGCDSKFKIDPKKYLNNLSKDSKEFIEKK